MEEKRGQPSPKKEGKPGKLEFFELFVHSVK
jgi:hypothetical protein